MGMVMHLPYPAVQLVLEQVQNATSRGQILMGSSVTTTFRLAMVSPVSGCIGLF